MIWICKKNGYFFNKNLPWFRCWNRGSIDFMSSGRIHVAMD